MASMRIVATDNYHDNYRANALLASGQGSASRMRHAARRYTSISLMVMITELFQ